MGITALVKNEKYEYRHILEEINNETIDDAKQKFKEYKSQGIIQNESFDEEVWNITDEVTRRSISFKINELDFEANCRRKLGCTQSQYAITMRVVITMLFGSDISTLQGTASAFRRMIDVVAGRESTKVLEKMSLIILDFMDLLPGETLFRNELRDKLDILAEYTQSSQFHSGQARDLSTYSSYFRFCNYLDKFWEQADTEEKLFYFPLYMWWQITTILPLRPTEFILTPRNCIARRNGRVWLTVRRTRLKGRKLKAEYLIERDYEFSSHEITDILANEIEAYIEGTEESYHSDLNTLFCKYFYNQYLQLASVHNSLHHFTYSNLRHCLLRFYNHILQNRIGLTLRDVETGIGHHVLGDNEIERIKLGDTRHIAMINLIVTTKNPLICKELARHDSINISSSYYSNIRRFVEALSFTIFRERNPNYAIPDNPSAFVTQDMPELDSGGRCASEKTKEDIYSDCMSAINHQGHLLDCESCIHYIFPKNKSKTNLNTIIKNESDRERDLHDSYYLLMYAIESVRAGRRCETSIRSALLRAQASANQYTNALIKKYEMENV